MGHYDECRPGYCSICGQALGYCDHTEDRKPFVQPISMKEDPAIAVGRYFCAAMPCGPGDCGPPPCRYLKDAIANRNNRALSESYCECRMKVEICDSRGCHCVTCGKPIRRL